MKPYVQLLPRLCAKREFQGDDGQALCQPAFLNFNRFRALLSCAPPLRPAATRARSSVRVRACATCVRARVAARARRATSPLKQRREAWVSGAHRVAALTPRPLRFACQLCARRPRGCRPAG
jgi:hypothetical protein